MVDNRREKQLSRDATTARGRDGEGNMTPIRESKKGGSGEHAEPQVLNDLDGKPKPHTVMVDQTPCGSCSPKLKDSGARVVVPSKPSNPKGSPKTAARAGAEKGQKVTTREIKEDEL